MASAGPSAASFHRARPSACEASSNVRRMTAESPYANIIPTDWDPCPGKTSARLIVILKAESELEEDGAPGKSAADALEQQIVAVLHPSLTHGGVQRERDRRRR